MSFGTYARKVRDPALPLHQRVTALRSAVELYQPIGWHLTLRFPDQAVGGYSTSERALVQALELLEESRRHWLTEVRSYARDRRAAKATNCRSPRAPDPNPCRRPTGWYGPLRPAASLHALAVWRTRLSGEDPAGQEVQMLASACLATCGALTADQTAALARVVADLGRRVRSAAARGDTGGEFRAVTVLRVADLIIAATAGVPADGAREHARHDGRPDAAWKAELEMARADDGYRSDRSRSWVPPIMSALVAAAMNSTLRGLFPFTSHNLLRFSRAPYLGLLNAHGIAPAFVALVPDPDRSVVFSGAFDAERWRAVFESTDPAAVVARVERLLSAWP